MEFIKAFEEIDIDRSGEITRDELYCYMRKKNYKSTFVDKWLKVFDVDKSGTITLEEYCNTLGLIPRVSQKIIIEKRNSLLLSRDSKLRVSGSSSRSTPEKCSQKGSRSGRDLYIIDDDGQWTPDRLRRYALDQCDQAVQEHSADSLSIARRLKLNLDQRFGRCWNVVVDCEAYGSLLSHAPGYFVHVKADRYAVLLWKVPEDDSD